jgi:hypothetical protein
VLKRNLSLLHNVFNHFVSISIALASGPRAKRGVEHLSSSTDWLAGLRAVDLLEGDLSERDALRCYSWSRMVVDDNRTAEGEFKDRALPFEGFVEALCRVSALKALPTEEEIDESGYGDAGSYMRRLKSTSPPEYAELQRHRKRAWSTEVPQDFARCVEHTVSIFHMWVMQHKKKE